MHADAPIPRHAARAVRTARRRRRWAWSLGLGVPVLVLLAGVVWLGLDALTARTQLLAAGCLVQDLKTSVVSGDRAAAASTLTDLQGHAAQHRAEDLVGTPYLTHASLDAVMSECGVSTAGENLSRSSANPEDVVAAWMASPGHRANILDPTFTQIGVACVPDGDELLCSEVFLGP